MLADPSASSGYGDRVAILVPLVVRGIKVVVDALFQCRVFRISIRFESPLFYFCNLPRSRDAATIFSLAFCFLAISLLAISFLAISDKIEETISYFFSSIFENLHIER